MLPELEKKYHIVKEHFYPENYLPEDVSFTCISGSATTGDIITCDLVADYENNREYHVFQTDSKNNIEASGGSKGCGPSVSYCNAKTMPQAFPPLWRITTNS